MFRAVVAALELSPKLVVLSLAVLVMASISIRRHLLRRQYARYHGCQPISKSLNNDPFLGLDTLPGTICAIRQHKVLERGRGLFRVYGNTFTVKEIQRNAIVTTEPENIKTVLSLKFKDYSLSHRLEAFKPLLGEGIFNTDGEHWASSRALIRPSFAREQLADLRLLEELIQDLFGLLPRDGTTVDLQELFFRYTIDSATGFLFGQSVRTLRIGEPEFGFAEAFHYAQNAILARATLGPVLNSVYRDQKANECNYFCRTFVQRFVKGAVHAAEVRKQDTREGDKTKRKRIVFSHELASRTSDEERILDELMNVLLAGRDTTASLLGNLFFMLAKKPAIWKKLRSEVDILGNRPPTYEELQRLKYVQYCVNECMQMPSSFAPLCD